MALTRFKDGRTGLDGPVSGALQIIPVQFTALITGTTYQHTVDMPAGMALELVAINVHSAGVAGNPQISVGTAKAGTQIAAAATLTTNLGDLTLKTTVVPAGGILSVQIVNDATGDISDSVSVSVIGYVSAPPTSVEYR